MITERWRLSRAVVFSLVLHALLLSLTFGGDEAGLPGLGLPWQERRTEVPDLRAVLRPAPAPVLPIETADNATPALPAEPGSTDGFVAVLAAPAAVEPTTDDDAPPAPTQAVTVAAVDRAPTPATSDGPAEPAAETPPSRGRPAVIAMERPEEAIWSVPPASPPVAPPAAAGEATPPADAGADSAPAQPSVDATQEAARIEAERLEIRRQEAARLEAAKQDAARVEAARLEAQRQEAARLDAAKQDAARVEAARLEAQRQEAARLEAAKQEAARVEAARLEAQRQEAARLETAKQTARDAAARLEAERVQAERDEDERRDARRRALGRQLDEEAAKREAAAAARSTSTLPYSVNSARRARLWGRADTNAELVEYAEAWARKIQLNTSVATVQDMARRLKTNPLVTVAIRSDGSVESVTFVLSSGVPEVDDAIRRIVYSHAPYQAFSPGLAREYDVLEVRRTWHLDTAIRLY